MNILAREDWEARLIAFAHAELGRPFIWGETNCVALALQALDAQCGSGLMEKYRRHMASEARALAWVARHGLAGIVDRLVADGCQTIAPCFIQVGDVALVEMPGNVGASVCLGGRHLSSTSAWGVVQLRVDALQAPSVVLGVR